MWTKELEENTRAADSYMGGYTVGIIEGRQQGIETEKSYVIANLNAAGVPVEVIAKAVEMPVSKVLEIIESSKPKVA